MAGMARSSRLGRLLWLTAFGMAFGYVEAAVVVYLRELYYPGGFAFPLALLPTRILVVETVRELATLVMLWAVAWTAGGSGRARFGAFCFLFGVWDLVYYLVLLVVLHWPESLLAWDVLFLIPGVWAGPVLSAVLVAVSLIVAGVLFLSEDVRERPPVRDRWTWGGAMASLVLLLGSFLANHGRVQAGELPRGFPWVPYGLGFLLAWSVFFRVFLRRPRPPG